MQLNIMTTDGERIPVTVIEQFEYAGHKFFTHEHVDMFELEFRATEYSSGFAVGHGASAEESKLDAVEKLSGREQTSIDRKIAEAIEKYGKANE